MQNQIKLMPGGHALSVCFMIDTLAKLEILAEAMRETARQGGKIFEIPYGLVCGEVTWKAIAQAAYDAGIKEISICHFWGVNPDGTTVHGNPLGEDTERNRALATIEKIIEVAEILREKVVVRFIDGPTWGLLGYDHSKDITPKVQFKRASTFLRLAGEKCQKAGLILAVEFLRPEEDFVVGGTVSMIRLLEAVNHPNVKMHFDVYHAIAQGEDPASSIRTAGKWIVYLHLHGNLRVAPGSPEDNQNWGEIIEATDFIESGVEEIPALPEPFGEPTIKEYPPLGVGLPIPPEFPEYLRISYATFDAAGFQIAA